VSSIEVKEKPKFNNSPSQIRMNWKLEWIEREILKKLKKNVRGKKTTQNTKILIFIKKYNSKEKENEREFNCYTPTV
jgi:hypothetical protein